MAFPWALTIAERLADLPKLLVQAMKRVLNASTLADLHQTLEPEAEATVAGIKGPEITRFLSAVWTRPMSRAIRPHAVKRGGAHLQFAQAGRETLLVLKICRRA